MTVNLLAKYGTSRNGHALFAPSSSAGWLNCPGFLLANAVVGDTAGHDAAYGTVAHAVAEQWRADGYRPDAVIGQTYTVQAHDVLVDRIMLDYLQQYIEWCDDVPGEVHVEERVDLSDYMPIPKQRGTADHFVCAPGLLTITDLKMGTGVKVFVERNPQAMLYALGAFNEWDWIYRFERIVIRICQPRLDYFGVWECSRDELLEFGEWVRERALAAWSETAPRVPGDKQCRFCRVSATCPALSAHLDQIADDSFETEDADTEYSAQDMAQHKQSVLSEDLIPPGDPQALTTALLSYRYRYRRIYERWFRQIGEELLRRAQRGENVPGWKQAAGRRSYEWSSPGQASLELQRLGLDENDIVQAEMISVAQARDLLKARKMKPKQIKTALADVVREVPGRPTLVAESDDRQDSQEAMDDAFETEDDDL